MPIHCFNELTIEGDPHAVKALVARLEHEAAAADLRSRDALTFTSFVPRPDAVLLGVSGSASLGRDQHGAWVRVPIIEREDGTCERDTRDLTDVGDYRYASDTTGVIYPEHVMRERGLEDWWSWNTREWGTTRDAYDVEVDDSALEHGLVRYTFMSAWTPPEPVVLAMQAQLPGMRISLHATEPGMCFQVTTTPNGDVIEEPYYLDEEDADTVIDLTDAPTSNTDAVVA